VPLGCVFLSLIARRRSGDDDAIDDELAVLDSEDGERRLEGPSVAGDIFVSERQNGAGFGPATPVVELNDTTANDIQPNIRTDGLEVVFSSNRTGTTGTQDLWAATRISVDASWSPPVNLGPAVNTGAAETRPSLSKDGTQLLFGRAPGPEGGSDIFVATRGQP
jgi:Tol biopolymer transport system component